MAMPFAGAAREKGNRGPSGGSRGRFQYVLFIGGFCLFIGFVWLAWRYEKFEALRRLWQDQGKHRFRPLPYRNGHGPPANISILASAVESGAVCLDGSPPAYFLERGKGEGADKWVVFLEGGGWCDSDLDCLSRAFTDLGSSKRMPRQMYLDGILSSSFAANPDFYDWNKVLVKYCDGGSFNGDVSVPIGGLPYKDTTAYPIFYRGQRIWKAVMAELMELGMKDAQKALLTGCSAGGLATILHCDQYRDLMPTTTVVKCMSDAGFFIDIPDISGKQTIETFYAKIVRMHHMFDNLPKSCTSETVTKCFFPEYLIAGVKTPLFILNPAYDAWQFDNILLPRAADPEGVWDDCRTVFSFCSESQLVTINGYRNSFLQRLQPLLDNSKDGAFINSCHTHCQAGSDDTWSAVGCSKVDNKSMQQALGDWYFERNVTKVVDCPYPCNPTCSRYT